VERWPRKRPGATAAPHQSLRFCRFGGWDEQAGPRIRQIVLLRCNGKGAIEAWIIDHTGFPQTREAFGSVQSSISSTRQGGHCQCVSLSIAITRQLPVPTLYLPKEWARQSAAEEDGRAKGHRFKTKPEIALDQIRWACELTCPAVSP